MLVRVCGRHTCLNSRTSKAVVFPTHVRELVLAPGGHGHLPAPSKAMSDGIRLSPDLWSQEGSGTPGISEPGKSGSLKREGKVARTMERPNSK